MKPKQSQIIVGFAALALGLLASSASAGYGIPEDQLDAQKVYYGNSEAFETPASVKIEDVLKATPEYDEIKKKKIERGTGKYWILVSQAQERSKQAIAEVGKESDYDLICEDGYLDELEPAIPSVDVTESVLEKLEE